MSSTFIGKVIDNYRIIENLGIGGMGVVFKAIHIKLDKLFALKMIAPGLLMNENFINRFQTEAKALAKLEDPNIVRIYDFRSYNDQWFIVMEYVDGTNLLTRIKNEGIFTWQEALPIIKNVLSAIGHAHENDIIHRDIKPNNIMLATDGSVKITDFGLAKDHTAFSNTMTVASGGTLYYMSPEHLRGFSFTDKRSDIYSIGMTLYEMITGQVPFSDINSDFDLREAIVRKDMPKPSSINPEIPSEVEQLVLRAIAKDPARRFQSTTEMLKAITEFEENEAASEKKIQQKKAAVNSSGAGSVSKSRENILFQKIREVSTLFQKLSVFQKLIIMIPGLLVVVVLFLIFLKEKSTSDEKLDYVDRLSNMSISSNPSRATVYLNGDSIGITPLQKYVVAFGDYSLRLVKPDYQAVDSNLVIESGLPLDLSFNLMAMQKEIENTEENNIVPSRSSIAEKKAGRASLTINSTPENASVLIEDKFQGSTPINLSDMIPGKYQINIQKEGFNNYRQEIDVGAGQHSTLDVSLILMAGGLVVLSKPADAIVKLDGKFIENKSTPLSISQLATGSHKIDIDKNGYSLVSKNLEIKAGKIDTIMVELTRLTGRLSIQVRPWGTIYIDNQMKKSSTDLKFETELPVQEYSLKITHPTLGIWEKKVTLSPEKSTNLTVNFNKLLNLSIYTFDQDGNPLSADIFLDEQPSNHITPAELPVRVGIHKISVKKNGYVAENNNRTVLVDHGPLESLTFILKKIE